MLHSGESIEVQAPSFIQRFQPKVIFNKNWLLPNGNDVQVNVVKGEMRRLETSHHCPEMTVSAPVHAMEWFYMFHSATNVQKSKVSTCQGVITPSSGPPINTRLLRRRKLLRYWPARLALMPLPFNTFIRGRNSH